MLSSTLGQLWVSDYRFQIEQQSGILRGRVCLPNSKLAAGEGVEGLDALKVVAYTWLVRWERRDHRALEPDDLSGGRESDAHRMNSSEKAERFHIRKQERKG